MAINRYLYPPDGTNIPKFTQLATRVAIKADGTVDSVTAGKGLTITPTIDGVNTVYTVSIDNGSSVSSVLNVLATYVVAFDKAKHIAMSVKSVSTTGCVLQATDPQSNSVGPIDVAGELCVTLTCQASGVVA